MNGDLKKTPLHAQHLTLGATMAPFAGYEMPLYYAGTKSEHQAVRSSAGIFDVSHMAEFRVSGAEATSCVDHLITNRIADISVGRAVYSMMCNDEGGIIDDLIVYKDSDSDWLLVVNANRRAADWSALEHVAEKFDCQIEDISDSIAQIALQGPSAMAVLSDLRRANAQVPSRFCFENDVVAGVENVRIARTGYTGEDGVEFYVKASDAEKLWSALNADARVEPCGLGARDTLRLEMKFPLYGTDIDTTTHPFEAGLGWTVKLDKGPFRGRDALIAKKEKIERKWVGLLLQERGVPRTGCEVLSQDGASVVGTVSSGTFSPSLSQGIAAAWIQEPHCKMGHEVKVKIRQKELVATVVKPPFIKKD